MAGTIQLNAGYHAQDTPTIEIPSTAKLLAAGQRRETLEAPTIYGRCHVANIPGKGRGLVAADMLPAGALVLLEPALASAQTYEGLAAELVKLVVGSSRPAEAATADGVLLRQLLSLAMQGQTPTSVEQVSDANEKDHLRRQAPTPDVAAFDMARSEILGDDVANDDAFIVKLQERLQAACQANAFRSPHDQLTSLAYHVLSPAEQLRIDPSKVPEPFYWLFLRASLINHSEAPNCTWLVAGGNIAVRTAKSLRKGEEILTSYWPDVGALEAAAANLPANFGFDATTMGEAAEFSFSEEQLKSVDHLRSAPRDAAAALAALGAGSDVALAFDTAAKTLTTVITDAEKVLPKDLRTFLEPRIFLVQLTLQQAAVTTAQGDSSRGGVLRKVAVARLKSALTNYPRPWGKRVLTRLLFASRGLLRPALGSLLASGELTNDEAGPSADFSVQLAKQARLCPEEVLDEFKQAIEDVYGDEELLMAVLSKCGVSMAE